MSTEEATDNTTGKQLSPKKAAQFLEKIQTIVQAGREASMELCWAAYESDVSMTRDSKGELVFCWKAWGYDSWEEFVGKELDLHVTTAYAYKKIWEVFYVELAGAWDVSLLLGITKMRHVSNVEGLTKSNVTAWLKRAKKMTCRELVPLVYNQPEKFSFAVPLTARQMKTTKKALDQAKTVYGNEKMTRGEAITEILQEWMQMKGIVEGKRVKASKVKLRVVKKAA